MTKSNNSMDLDSRSQETYVGETKLRTFLETSKSKTQSIALTQIKIEFPFNTMASLYVDSILVSHIFEYYENDKIIDMGIRAYNISSTVGAIDTLLDSISLLKGQLTKGLDTVERECDTVRMLWLAEEIKEVLS